MNEKELMLSGHLYIASDKTLAEERARARRLTHLYNNTSVDEAEYRNEILDKLLGSHGKNILIEPDFHCDYGYNIHVGDNFFANFGCIILDVCEVTIGNNVLFAPGVSIYAAAHPTVAEIRNMELECGGPVTIGNNVWIGGNTVINPNVTIGDNAVIGSGSVVTKDIPPNVIAAGNPCRIIREINESDYEYWRKKVEFYRQNKD
ncbi:MAG: sugar O-acetyltransferase [Clostridiales bacterium]|nr:sugar O-acetyltransferase [Clostridiales bacterium]